MEKRVLRSPLGSLPPPPSAVGALPAAAPPGFSKRWLRWGSLLGNRQPGCCPRLSPQPAPAALPNMDLISALFPFRLCMGNCIGKQCCAVTQTRVSCLQEAALHTTALRGRLA